MTGPFRFGADELGPTEGHELNDAMDAVRAMELAASDVAVTTGPAFSARVMDAIAHEPSPAPTGFLAPLRRAGLLGGFGESVRQAWLTVGTSRPPFARGAALAYVLLVATAGVSVVGAASFGAANALGILPPSSTVSPTSEPDEASEPTTVPATETDEPSVEPRGTAEPTETSPVESERPDGHGTGGEPEGTDGHGDSSGSGGGEGDRSSPGATEQPDASDDHGGSGLDGSGSGGSDSGSVGGGG